MNAQYVHPIRNRLIQSSVLYIQEILRETNYSKSVQIRKTEKN